jgi:hypothetical protein
LFSLLLDAWELDLPVCCLRPQRRRNAKRSIDRAKPGFWIECPRPETHQQKATRLLLDLGLASIDFDQSTRACVCVRSTDPTAHDELFPRLLGFLPTTHREGWVAFDRPFPLLPSPMHFSIHSTGSLDSCVCCWLPPFFFFYHASVPIGHPIHVLLSGQQVGRLCVLRADRRFERPLNLFFSL